MSKYFREILGDILVIVYSALMAACFISFLINGKLVFMCDSMGWKWLYVVILWFTSPFIVLGIERFFDERSKKPCLNTLLEIIGDAVIILNSIFMTLWFSLVLVNNGLYSYEHIMVILIIELTLNILGVILGINRLVLDVKEREGVIK